VLEQMLQRRQMPHEACVALSKLYEHKLKDIPQALYYAEKAHSYPGDEEALRRRIERLRSRMED
jgi:hypothetical protein